MMNVKQFQNSKCWKLTGGLSCFLCLFSIILILNSGSITLNSSQANAPFLYPLKMLENQKFSRDTEMEY